MRRAGFVLVPSRTATADENVELHNPEAVPPVFLPTRSWKAGRFILNITNIATDAGDTVNVYLQSGTRRPNSGGIIWDDFVHFTQIAGNASEPVQHIAVWQRDGQTPESEMHVPQTDDISSGAVIQGPLGEYFRMRTLVADSGDGNSTVTYEVFAEIEEDA